MRQKRKTNIEVWQGPLLPFAADRLAGRAARQVLLHMCYRRAGLPVPNELRDPLAPARMLFNVLPDLAPALASLLCPAAGDDPDGVNDDAGPAPAPDPVEPHLIEVPDLLLGTSGTTAQFALLGRTVAPDGTVTHPAAEPVYLDTNGCEFFAVSGANGSGKSSGLGVLIENHMLHMRGISKLQRKRCTVIFVLHSANRELLAAVQPNTQPDAVQRLATIYGTRPQPMSGLHRWVLPSVLQEAQLQSPSIPVSPIVFSPGQLDARSWELLMGLEDHAGSLYVRTAMKILSELREQVTVERLRQAMNQRKLPTHVRALFEQHLDLAQRFLSDGAPPLPLVKEGQIVLVEIRDSWLKLEGRVVLASVLLELIVRQAQEQGVPLLIGFEECHNVLGQTKLDQHVDTLIRERRGLSLSLALLGLDMLKLPARTLALASFQLLGRNSSEENLQHYIKADPRWRHIPRTWLVDLLPGQFFLLAMGGRFGRGLEHFTERPRRVAFRDRVSQHGGDTRTAVPA